MYYYILLFENKNKGFRDYIITRKHSKKNLINLIKYLAKDNIIVYNTIAFKTKRQAQEYIDNCEFDFN